MSRRTRPLLRRATAVATVLATAVVIAPAAPGPATAAPGPAQKIIPLPDGFQPEGVAVGTGGLARTAWFGSRADGDIYVANVLTGRGRILAQGPGTPSLGLKLGRAGLFVAGGSGGDARVLNQVTGETVASYQLVEGDGAFINDVVLTPGAAWFTDSTSAQLFKIKLGGRGAPAPEAVRVPLRGQWRQQPDLNANGITTTPDGRALLVVNSATGQLFRVARGTGRATEVDLTGLGAAGIANGDGLLREGRTLYAVQNRLNRVAVLRLTRDGSAARLVRRITSPAFDVPTTVARSRDGLVLPNARFSTTPTPTTTYDAVRVRVPAPRR